MSADEMGATPSADQGAYHAVDLSTKGGAVYLTVDLNKDGTPEAVVAVKMAEAVKEMFNRVKDKKENPKVRLDVVGTELVIHIDTDQDGTDAAVVRLNPLALLVKAGA